MNGAQRWQIADHARRGYAAGRLSADVFYRFDILTIRGRGPRELQAAQPGRPVTAGGPRFKIGVALRLERAQRAISSFRANHTSVFDCAYVRNRSRTRTRPA